MRGARHVLSLFCVWGCIAVCRAQPVDQARASCPAGPGATPFQLAFVAQVQMLPEAWDVWGLRVDLVSGCNRNVGGLDLGLLNETDGWEYGLQVGGLWNDGHGPLAGLQVAGLLNTSGETSPCQGVQLAGVNLAGVADGVQIGVFNHAAGGMTGVQIGLVNISERPLVGMQIGLINLDENGTIPFMPIMNFGF